MSVAAPYDRTFFDYLESASAPSASAIVASMVREFQPSSAVDVGCGTGVYLEQLQSRDVEVMGIENAPAALEGCRVERDCLLVHDLREPLALDRRFDLAISFEVAEHLEPEYAAGFVESLCALSDTVFFSAAFPGQGGVGHVNEQQWEYWLALFWQCGYELDVARTARLRDEWAAAGAPFWLSSNLAVLLRSPDSPDVLSGACGTVESVEGWLSPAEIRFLFSAARQTPRTAAIVEIGSWKGRATTALALGSRAGNGAPVFSIDHHHGEPEIARLLGIPLTDVRSWDEFQANLDALRLTDIVTPILKDSLAAEATWDGPPIALLWIDGGHDYELVSGDFAAWSQHVRPGGIIAFHDTTHLEGPRRAVEAAIAQGQLRCPVRVDSITYGIAPETPPKPSANGFPRLLPRRERRERISLIITTRNEGDHLRKTIDSLLANTFYPDFEALILDDASEDGSCDFLSTAPYARDERLRYFRYDAQKGYLALRIEAPQLATGSVFQFLDAHHWFAPDWLTNLYESLRRRNFEALVGPAVSVLDPDSWQPTATVGYGLTADLNQAQYFPIGRESVRARGQVPALTGHQLMVSREVYESVGGWCPLFQGHCTEDPDFCFRAFILGYDCYVEPSAMIAHLHKRQFMNPVTWGQWMLNYFILVYLNLGEEKFEELKSLQKHRYGYAEGLESFESLRPDIERFRRWIVQRQRRSAEELLAQLIPLTPQPFAVSG